MNNTLSKEIEKIIEDCKDVDYGEDSATLIFYNDKAIEQLLQLVQQENRREAIEFRKWVNRNIDTATSYLTTEEMYDLYLLHKQNKEQ